MLRTASVIGREFDFELLQALRSEISHDRLLEALEEAVAARAIEELPQAVGQFQFPHTLIQETLSAELSTLRQARLHGVNAEAHAAELVRHFVEAASAAVNEKLVHYSLVARERALAAYAWEEAEVHFCPALDPKRSNRPILKPRTCCSAWDMPS